MSGPSLSLREQPCSPFSPQDFCSPCEFAHCYHNTWIPLARIHIRRPRGECTQQKALKPTSEAPGRVHNTEAPESTSEAPGRVRTTEGPHTPTGSPEESAHLNLWDQRLLGNWAGGWPSADQELRKAKLSPPQLAADKKTRKTALARLKPAGGFSFKVILYYFFIIIFVLTHSSSLSFFFVLFLLSFPLYLFFLPSSSSF